MSGPQLKRLRLIHKITQKDLAKKLGVTRQALCMWEANKREIKVGFLKKIAKTFNVSVDDIISSNKILLPKKEKEKMKAKAAAKKPKAEKKVSVKKNTSTAKAKVATKSSMPDLKNSKKVQIKLEAPQAKNVLLLGDFNAWDAAGIKMEKNNRGTWKTDVYLEPGRYEYKFMVDNEWWLDPTNQNIVWNDVGAQNSVFDLN